jgi:hypothetical protein
MTRQQPHLHPCHLVSITGAYLTPIGTFSSNPATALTAERWWMEREQARVNAPTVIIRAA